MTAIGSQLKNFACCEKLAQEAREAGAAMLFLPEACSFIGESAAETIAMATTLDSPVLERFKDLAACHSLWISLGGYQESSG